MDIEAPGQCGAQEDGLTSISKGYARSWRHIIMLAAFAWVMPAIALAIGPQVQTWTGRIEGASTEDGGAIFRGVPFAAAPTGPLRWRPPQPVQSWPGVRGATVVAPSCPQSVYGAWNARDAERGREDCLYLDVRTPQLTPSTLAPVMVWIHGGGNRAGSMGDAVLSSLAKRGVVLVAVQYRLAALGFMSHLALSRESGGSSGAYGLMDQIAALRWVQGNIARFGGDPRRVTIFGQSAGAQDVGLLMLAPSAAGLFSRAIEESGTADFGRPARSLAEAEGLGEVLAIRAGAPPHASAATLRSLPIAALLHAPDTAPLPGVADPSAVWLRTTVDGAIVQQPPETVLASSQQRPTPLIIGVNAREITGGNAGDDSARLFGRRAAEARQLYGFAHGVRPATDPRFGDAFSQMADDATFRCPAVQVAASFARIGSPVWLYQYDVAPQGGPVAHTAELPSVFDGWPVSPPGARAPYSLEDYWIAFAERGRPAAPGLPAWPSQTGPLKPYLDFTPGGPVLRRDLRSQICRLLPAF